jgi:DNA (cytosine-5)-methyltransferase 1
MENCSVVDIFCGAGGLTHGFVKEGFKVIAGVDSDDTCGFAYEHNNDDALFIPERVEHLDINLLKSLYPHGHTKILVGCAPCQPYSKAPRENRSKVEKWELLNSFAKLVESVEPDVVSMENVPELQTFNGGSIYNKFVERLVEVGYIVTSFVAYCPDYGVPQKRKRLVLFASKRGKVELVEPTHTPHQYKTVGEAIGHLPALAAGGVCPNDPLHSAANLTEINILRIMQSYPGGTWRDWDPELVLSCHKKQSGESYDAVYGRMAWHDLSPTITTQFIGYGSGRFGHPEQDRAISLREGALLQTFPEDYLFFEHDQKWFMERVAKLIGNAVPVDLGRAIARSIKQHLRRPYEQ